MRSERLRRSLCRLSFVFAALFSASCQSDTGPAPGGGTPVTTTATILDGTVHDPSLVLSDIDSSQVVFKYGVYGEVEVGVT